MRKRTASAISRGSHSTNYLIVLHHRYFISPTAERMKVNRSLRERWCLLSSSHIQYVAYLLIQYQHHCSRCRKDCHHQSMLAIEKGEECRFLRSPLTGWTEDTIKMKGMKWADCPQITPHTTEKKWGDSERMPGMTKYLFRISLVTSMNKDQ